MIRTTIILFCFLSFAFEVSGSGINIDTSLPIVFGSANNGVDYTVNFTSFLGINTSATYYLNDFIAAGPDYEVNLGPKGPLQHGPAFSCRIKILGLEPINIEEGGWTYSIIWPYTVTAHIAAVHRFYDYTGLSVSQGENTYETVNGNPLTKGEWSGMSMGLSLGKQIMGIHSFVTVQSIAGIIPGKPQGKMTQFEINLGISTRI